jgi:DNA polymerase III delta prime subunit
MSERGTPTGYQHYKEGRDKDTINWAELHFFQLDRLLKAKMGKDHEAFIDAVDATEAALEGFKDEKYDQERRMVDVALQKSLQKVGPNRAMIDYYEQKFRILFGLAARVRTTKPKLLQYVGQDEITKEIAYKLITGTGQNLFITGKTGSGKSYSAIALAKAVTDITAGEHPNAAFDIKKHIAFTPQEFIRIYNDENITPPGSAIIFDEVGVTLAARDAATRGNKIFSKLMQIIRHRRIFVILTAPDLSFVDKSARKMLHWWLETKKIDKALDRCHINPHVIEVIQSSGDVITPHPVFNGRQVGELVIDKIGKAVADEYEAVAKSYKDEVARTSELSLLNEQAKDKNFDPLRDKFVEMKKSGMNLIEIRKVLNISKNLATKYHKYYYSLIAIEKSPKPSAEALMQGPRLSEEETPEMINNEQNN